VILLKLLCFFGISLLKAIFYIMFSLLIN